MSVVSVYFPSGSSSEERQQAKFRFLEEFAPHQQKLLRHRTALLIGRAVLEIVKAGIFHLDHLDTLEHDLSGAALVALDLHQFLQLVARAADGEALVVQQVADAPDHQHLMVLVIAPVAAPLHWPQLREFLLPIP